MWWIRISSIGVKDGWRDLVSDFQHYEMYIFWFRMRTTRQLRSMFPVLYHSGWPSLRKWMVARELSGILLIGAVESSWRRSNGLQKQRGLYYRWVEMSSDKLNKKASIARRLYLALTSWANTSLKSWIPANYCPLDKKLSYFAHREPLLVGLS